MSSAPININSSLGAIEIGVVVSTLLFGVLTLQVYQYYSNFPGDTVGTKIQVAFIWFCELGSAICVAHALYLITATHYGDIRLLITPPSSIPIGMIFASFIPPLVHTYFAFRIYKLSKRWYIPALSIALSVLSWAGLFVVAVKAIHMVTLAQFVNQWTWLITANVFVRIMNDLLTTVTMVTYLLSRRDVLISSTLPIVDKLITWALETGFVTAVTSITMITSFLTLKHEDIWIGIFMVISRLYANSYMAALNNRLVLRAMKPDIILIGNQSGPNTPLHANMPSVQIELTQTVITSDVEAAVTRGAGDNDAKNDKMLKTW